MTDTAKQDEFLATARKHFATAREEERELREKFNSDLKFASPDGDDQWDPQLKQQREAAGRPAMSFPRGHTFVQQVANQARQQKPQIKFAQSDSGNEEAADVMEGLARHIQYASDAQLAYDTAIEYSAAGSFGYYRILTDYADDESEDQEIKIVPVLDPLTVYGVLVPTIFGRKPSYWFVVEDVPKEEYKAQYGDKFLDNSLSWTEAESRADGWVNADFVRIAEYWYVKEEKQPGKRRPKRTIKFCKINGLEVLPDSETDWPGTQCNVIPVLGSQMIIEGKPRLFSVVRPQKSAQQLLNYSKSRIAETLAQNPVSPFIAVQGQLAGHEAEWATINTVPRPVVQYVGVDVGGKPAPPPQRQVQEPPIAALSSFVAQEVEDMKATTGIYDAALGSPGTNETSGQMVARRQQQSNLTTMHFLDNLERSFKRAGEVVGELIPKIYDASRTVKILGEDEEQKLVLINQQHVDQSGEPKHFDLANLKGTWVITSGKAFGTKRAETFDMMQQLVQSAPNMLPMFGDILFQSSDMAGGDIVAERFKKMLPPQLQDNQGQQLPPEAQAAIAQAQQQAQMMQAELQKLTMEKQAKMWEHQGKMQQIDAQTQASMALERMKLENALAIAEVETKAQSAQERASMIDDLWKQFHSQAHDAAMSAQEHAQQQQIAAQQAQHQSALADQSAQNQSAQSAQDAAQSQAQQEAAQQAQPEQ